MISKNGSGPSSSLLTFTPAEEGANPSLPRCTIAKKTWHEPFRYRVHARELSIVIPVYNEDENVEPLFHEIKAALEPVAKHYEVVIVDDGSRDETFSILAQLHAREPRLRVVRLKRNFGQTAAMAAGLVHADGDVVVTMDGDGQNDPADIPLLLEELDKGNDLVSGWRYDRHDPFINRRLPSKIANGLITTTRVKLHDYGCTLKAMRRDVAKNLRNLR